MASTSCTQSIKFYGFPSAIKQTHPILFFILVIILFIFLARFYTKISVPRGFCLLWENGLAKDNITVQGLHCEIGLCL